MADDADTLPASLSGLLEEEAAADQGELDDLFADYVSPEKDEAMHDDEQRTALDQTSSELQAPQTTALSEDEAMHDAEQRTALDQTSSELQAPQTTALDQASSEIKATENAPTPHEPNSPGCQPKEQAATNVGESREEKLDAPASATEPAQTAAEKDKYEDLEADLEAALDEAMDDDGLEAALEGVLEEAMAEEASMQELSPQKTVQAEQSSPQSPVPPVPPPPSPWAEKSTRSEDDFVDESRFMRDENDQQQYKWKVEYAGRGGAGKAMCRDSDCLERHRQDGVRSIEKGELRIGRRVLLDKESKVVMMWHHARCIFNTFLRSRKNTRVIESPEDLEGFEKVEPEDQDFLRRIIAGQEDVRKAQRPRTGPRTTPQKRGPDPDAETPAEKRQKEKEKKVEIKKGMRCWTFCRVRPAPGAGAGDAAVEFAVKSPKPELGVVVEEARDGNFIIQFESAEHEKERLEKFQNKRCRIKAWLRYPRVYEGKKQRIPSNWIQWSRPPPRLCSCAKQEWAHDCPCTGISCTRGTKTAVWGVCN